MVSEYQCNSDACQSFRERFGRFGTVECSNCSSTAKVTSTWRLPHFHPVVKKHGDCSYRSHLHKYDSDCIALERTCNELHPARSHSCGRLTMPTAGLIMSTSKALYTTIAGTIHEGTKEVEIRLHSVSCPLSID